MPKHKPVTVTDIFFQPPGFRLTVCGQHRNHAVRTPLLEVVFDFTTEETDIRRLQMCNLFQGNYTALFDQAVETAEMLREAITKRTPLFAVRLLLEQLEEPK